MKTINALASSIRNVHELTSAPSTNLNDEKSQQWYKRAQHSLPGGVNSPVRAFKAVSGTPPFIKKGEGAYLYDIDGNSYIDYVCSWGPLILGHAHPYVIEQVKRSLSAGFSFGATTPIEVQLAEKICAFVPSVEMVRFVNSGTEAAMSAIRLARGFTERNKIIKFAGCYHGHADSLLVSAGSGGLTFGLPSSAGVPASVARETLVADFNNLDMVAQLFIEFGDDVAAVIVEPVAGNMNLVMPNEGFLAGLRHLCDRYGALLIFDEVITGFRVALGGAQSYYDIYPDLTVLGKIMGGGFPVAAFGGRKEIMQYLAPLGPVYQAGTLSGNPVAMTAGMATMECLISNPNFYSDLTHKTLQLTQGLKTLADRAGVPLQVANIGGMFGLFFTEDSNPLRDENDVKKCNEDMFKQFFHGMLANGIYLAPSAFEIGFMSSVHGDDEIEQTLRAAEAVFNNIEG